MILNTKMMMLLSTIMSASMEETSPPSQHKFSIYLQDESAHVASLQSSNLSVPFESLNRSSSSTSKCSCISNQSDPFLVNAHVMMDQMINKTSMLSKIRHRATHSNEAVWASFTLSGLMVLLVVGVLQSKMWNDRTFISYPESQPVKFEQFNPKSEILVRELIRSRGRNLLSLFSRRKDNMTQKSTLKMETYLVREGDTVDSSHKALLESSEDEDDFYNGSLCDSESEEETIFKMNSKTGQWEGLAMEEDDATSSLLGRRRNRESISSTESRYSNSMINSSMARDLLRLSDSEVEGDEEKQLIKVG